MFVTGSCRASLTHTKRAKTKTSGQQHRQSPANRTRLASQAMGLVAGTVALGRSCSLRPYFALVASGIIIAGRYNSGYRLGQYLTQGVHARVDFSHFDKSRFAAAQQRARELEPRVYRPNPEFNWKQVEEQMRRWPDMAAGKRLSATAGHCPRVIGF